ncbi:hypothetical protein GCM10007160_25370 [Litchfieldella qijiaojingensis]|uniref:Uncharacterized protein n=1 Tax=Litchfieldella qijiaojingensis TaxID=980347 RepID=A0ABQ2YX27_9GAMM|nr:hypothetical protein [Halomonas qijiaojingensis]GGX96672.1 hypothetical protein GCM10007160_25370 [Halomonas qijiaojingensis]
MLDVAELIRRRNHVLGGIDQLSTEDALAVMTAAMCELTERGLKADKKASSSVALALESDPRSKIERDPEIRDFIHSLKGRRSIEQIAEACHGRFGDRAPGRSSIQRYLKRLKYRQGTGEARV